MPDFHQAFQIRKPFRPFYGLLRLPAVSAFASFRYSDTEGETTVEFVRRYFGGDFVAGLIKPETDYIAFWAYSQPQGVPDAVVTDDNGHRIYIYEVE